MTIVHIATANYSKNVGFLGVQNGKPCLVDKEFPWQMDYNNGAFESTISTEDGKYLSVAAKAPGAVLTLSTSDKSLKFGAGGPGPEMPIGVGQVGSQFLFLNIDPDSKNAILGTDGSLAWVVFAF